MIKTATALIIKNRKLLVLKKKKNKSHFILPGGKINEDENNEDALIRELKEELNISINKNNIKFITSMEVISQFENLPMTSYIFKADYNGDFSIDNEIAEFHWLNLDNYNEKDVASLLKKLIPYLKENYLI